MTITELVKESHGNALKKGFYDCPECRGKGSWLTLTPLGDMDECSYCDATGINQNKNIGELLMLVTSELGEALEAHRKGRRADFNRYNANCEFGSDITPKEERQIISFKDHIKDTFEDELSDAVIRIADMCGYLGIDLEKHIELKMKYNATREYKHGKRY